MLKQVTLGNLAEGRVEDEFQAALLQVMDAWEEGRTGPCTITLKLKLDKDPESKFVSIKSSTAVATPERSSASMLMLKDGRLQVETTTDNAREPGLFEGRGEAPVIPIASQNGGATS